MISRAALRPMARGRRKSPPAPAMRLRFTSARPNDDLLLATTRSQDKTISQPPAVAKPSTATMTGLRRSRYAIPAKPPRFVLKPPAFPELIALRSAPAQKTGFSWPAVFAVTIPTQISSSASMASSAASTPLATSPLTALRASGRFSVMMPMRPRFSKRTMSDIETS